MALMTSMRNRMHVVLWFLLIMFLLSMTIGGLVGGANIITTIQGEGETALYENGMWMGYLTSLSGFNGYWFRSNEAVDFSYDIPENALARQVASVEKQVFGIKKNLYFRL